MRASDNGDKWGPPVAAAVALLKRQRAEVPAGVDPELVADVELQFLWGVLGAIGPEERPDVLLMHYLVAFRNMPVNAAADRAAEISLMADDKEPLLTEIAAAGAKAVQQGGDGHLAGVISVLLAAQAGARRLS